MSIQFPKYDLHCHSTASDGRLSPEALLARAIDRRIEVLSLTDHDTLKGVKELIARADSSIQIIPGLELTASWNNRVLHIIGLGVDENDRNLNRYLEHLDVLRQARADKICERLVKQGVSREPLFSAVKENSAGAIVGRPHIAKSLVDMGVVNSEQAAFKQYLGTGKTGDVKMDWPSFTDAISVINGAGGEAVLAHPTKYKMTFTKIRAVVNDFVAGGGSAIEVSYTGISPNHQADLERLARKMDIMVSAGSDFHSPSHGWTDVGKFPPVKDLSRHVLSKLLQA